MGKQTVERPILMNGEMVRAVLAGRKTVTRRLLRLPPGVDFDGHNGASVSASKQSEPTGTRTIECPVARPGDRLYVRESAFVAPPNFGDVDLCTVRDSNGRPRMVGYVADLPGGDSEEARSYGLKVTPSILLPKWASRIFLDVVSVRVERLQDITAADAVAEGAAAVIEAGHALRCVAPIDAFAVLWDSLAHEGSRWSDNPWVWRIAFTRGEA